MADQIENETPEPHAIYDPLSDTPTNYLRDPAGAHPPMDFAGYKSTALRHPKQPLILLPQTITEITGPRLRDARVAPADNDLTTQHAGAPIGERIILSGHVYDTEGKPLRDTLVEIWQADAAGRYRFTTIKPGPYPWGNHHNAWRPAHIHFSLLGRAFAQRLVTQMYSPGDPFFACDPIFNSVADPAARQRMVSRFSIHDTIADWAAAYQFDIYLRGPGQTPFEEAW
jgi:protocatechuate 3,4-dioxygenase beta subunit